MRERPTKVPPPEFPTDKMDVDFARIEQVLGLKEHFRGIEETILEIVDSLTRLEKEWIANEQDIEIPTS